LRPEGLENSISVMTSQPHRFRRHNNADQNFNNNDVVVGHGCFLESKMIPEGPGRVNCGRTECRDLEKFFTPPFSNDILML